MVGLASSPVKHLVLGWANLPSQDHLLQALELLIAHIGLHAIWNGSSGAAQLSIHYRSDLELVFPAGQPLISATVWWLNRRVTATNGSECS
jgi:hypothetical protein